MYAYVTALTESSFCGEVRKYDCRHLRVVYEPESNVSLACPLQRWFILCSPLSYFDAAIIELFKPILLFS